MTEERAEQDGSEARGSGLGRAVRSGLAGESLSARGLLDAVGGVRGIIEALVPAAVYLVLYIVTRDPRVSVIAPLVLALAAFGWRLARKEPWQGALSGVIGVLVCAGVTLFTGRGEDYFLPGFFINGAWITALTISVLVGWPLLGLLVGYLRGSLTAWRKEPLLRRIAYVTTILWIGLFAARLLVQLPLYSAGATEALGLARLFMGVPLFALAIAITWMLFTSVGKRIDEATPPSPSSDELRDRNVENPGQNSSPE